MQPWIMIAKIVMLNTITKQGNKMTSHSKQDIPHNARKHLATPRLAFP